MSYSMREPYTETDAAYEIITWQMPVAFIAAVSMVGSMIPTHKFVYDTSNEIVPWMGRVMFVGGYIMACYISIFLGFLCIDMLLLPVLFSSIRLSKEF
jgi:hypothetical protein